MDAKASETLWQIKRELQSIINELDSISSGVRRDFSGIGNEVCADCITRVANHYRDVKRRLDTMDTNILSDEFISAQGGGGGGGGGGSSFGGR